MNKAIEEAVKEHQAATLAEEQQFFANYKRQRGYDEVARIAGSSFSNGAVFALSHQWISVNERLPEDRQQVVYMFRWRNPRTGVWHEDGVDACRYDKDYGFRTDNENVTFWMPVPELNPQQR